MKNKKGREGNKDDVEDSGCARSQSWNGRRAVEGVFPKHVGEEISVGFVN